MSESRTEEEIKADGKWRRRADDPNDPYGKDREVEDTDEHRAT